MWEELMQSYEKSTNRLLVSHGPFHGQYSVSSIRVVMTVALTE